MIKNIKGKIIDFVEALFGAIVLVLACLSLIGVLGCLCYSHYWHGKYHKFRLEHEHKAFLKIEAGEESSTSFGPCPGCRN